MQTGEVADTSFTGLKGTENLPLVEGGGSSPKRTRLLRCPCAPRGLSNRCPCGGNTDGSGGSCKRKVLKWLKANLLLLLTIASVVVGTVIGLSVREVSMPRHSEGYRLMVTLLGFPGELFLRMLKMLILPLIVFSLIAGLGSLETKVAGSLGWKTVAYYATTTLLAVVLGLVLVNVIKPGERDIPLECDNSTVHAVSHELEVVDTVLDLLRYV